MSDEPATYADVRAAMETLTAVAAAKIAALRSELEAAKAKNAELHRRCQFAEGAVMRKMTAEQAGGVPIAKRLALAGYAAEQERRIAAEARITELEAERRWVPVKWAFADGRVRHGRLTASGWEDAQCYGISDVSHWRAHEPVPAPPPCRTCGGCGEVQVEESRIFIGGCGRPRDDGSCCGDEVPTQEIDVTSVPCPDCYPDGRTERGVASR